MQHAGQALMVSGALHHKLCATQQWAAGSDAPSGMLGVISARHLMVSMSK